MAAYPTVPAEEVDIRAGYIKPIDDQTWGIVILIGGKEYLIDFGAGGISIFPSWEEACDYLCDAWGISSGRDDPASFPVINWDEVPESARLQERRFQGGVWGIMAILPDGEHLVLFDQFANLAGYQTFYADRENARNAVAFLEMLQAPPKVDPQVKTRLDSVTTFPPFIGGRDSAAGGAFSLANFEEREHLEDLLVALDKVAEEDCRKVQELEREWRRRLDLGSRRSCLCRQCRQSIRSQLDRILDWYDRGPGYIPFSLEQAANRLLVLLEQGS